MRAVSSDVKSRVDHNLKYALTLGPTGRTDARLDLHRASRRRTGYLQR